MIHQLPSHFDLRRGLAGLRSILLLIFVFLCAQLARPLGGEHGHDSDDHQSRQGQRITAHVFDRSSGVPVANALVELSGRKGTQRGSTDSNGIFLFLLSSNRNLDDEDGDGRGHDDALSLTVISNLYITVRRELSEDRHRTSRLEIGLRHKPSNQIGKVHGTVTNSDTGNGIAGTVVTILGAGEVLSAITGSDGTYTISQVGFNPNLQISFDTSDPPCMVPAVLSLRMNSIRVAADYASSLLKVSYVHCPTSLHQPFEPVGGGATGGESGLPDDRNIQWHQADLLSIQVNADANAWHAGHVNDFLVFEPGGGMLAATETGGVWAITSVAQAIPLSDTWPANAMTSLAPGPDGPRHAFAGTWPDGASAGGVLWETDTSAIFPTLNWSQVNPAPPCGSINQILVIPEKRRIVLACDSGLYWSQIPAAPSVHGIYNWIDATPANVQQGRGFASVVRGPGWNSDSGEGTIVAAKWGGYAPGDAIYYGGWSGGTLQVGATTVDQGSGNLFLGVGRTSLASCPGDPTQVYAVAEDGNNNFSGVWRSQDGGANFVMTTFPSNPGVQGSYNNAIAISSDCRVVALGWQAGTFVSYDAGGSWNLLASSDGHLHGDVHALRFDPSDPTTLFIGSDGGVASARGLVRDHSPTFESDWSRQLFDLQFYHGDGSSAASGLVSGSAQDSGVIWSGLPGPWINVSNCGCDGRWSRFIAPPSIASGDSILLFEEWGAPDWPFGFATANGNSIPSNSGQTIPVVPANPPVLTNVVTEEVRNPGGYQNASGQTLYAVGGTGTSIYGIFAGDDGGNLHWEPLGQIGGGQNVSALSPTFNGQSIFVGTDKGNIYRLDAPFTGPAVQLSVNPPSGASGGRVVSGLAGFFSSIAYATINFGNNGHVLFWNGTSWDAVSGNPPNNLKFSSIQAPDISNLYVSTQAAVYDSHDGGATWNRASDGLPAMAQASELRIVTEPAGTYLYLVSYGRSLWRTTIP
jgi:hypothetical protein